MSLGLLGFITIALFLGAVWSNRVSVLVASILIPTAVGLVAGAAPQLGDLMLAGVLRVAPIAIMIMFAILYFGLMLEVGLFEPLVRGLLTFIGVDPLRLCLASVALPMLVALDGDGATTFLISTTALLPIHRLLGLRPIIFPGLLGLAAGVMNILPWGGATTRAMAVLEADAGQMFLPLLPPMIAGRLWVVLVALLFGLRERRRLADVSSTTPPRDREHASGRFVSDVRVQRCTHDRSVSGALSRVVAPAHTVHVRLCHRTDRQ